MKEINKVLALVCILREENFTKPGRYLYITCLGPNPLLELNIYFLIPFQMYFQG